jgi:hypothetical protein
MINSKNLIKTLANSIHSNDSGSDGEGISVPMTSNIDALGRTGNMKNIDVMVTRSS